MSYLLLFVLISWVIIGFLAGYFYKKISEQNEKIQELFEDRL